MQVESRATQYAFSSRVEWTTFNSASAMFECGHFTGGLSIWPSPGYAETLEFRDHEFWRARTGWDGTIGSKSCPVTSEATGVSDPYFDGHSGGR